MNLMVLLLTAGIFSGSVHAENPPEHNFERHESGQELAVIWGWVGSIVEEPEAAARHLSDAFRRLPAHDWSTRFVTETKALDLLGYFVAVERARAAGLPTPGHWASQTQLEFYDRIIDQGERLGLAGPQSAPARVFARRFLNAIVDNSFPIKRFGLFKNLLAGDREFWAEQLIEEMFVRGAVPRRENLLSLLPYVSERNFERFARAIGEHRDDFRFSQMLMNRLVQLRRINRPVAAPLITGHELCDKMLETARTFRLDVRRQKSAD